MKVLTSPVNAGEAVIAALGAEVSGAVYVTARTVHGR
ncbi:hypothetical protein YW7DRAFT_06132 [Streptomyces sp. AmelKG-E11A]|nr:hypothetical protein YW7DRAFT_06132 [Streptomyces sp. AmelKG-E11A]